MLLCRGKSVGSWDFLKFLFSFFPRLSKDQANKPFPLGDKQPLAASASCAALAYMYIPLPSAQWHPASSYAWRPRRRHFLRTGAAGTTEYPTGIAEVGWQVGQRAWLDVDAAWARGRQGYRIDCRFPWL